MIKVFLPQTTLEEWAADSRADLKDGKLFVGPDRIACRVAPAVHFLRLVSGKDAKKLVATVKTPVQLEQMGAEQMLDSVILGEDAYEVAPGYLAEVPVALAPENATQSPDTDLLAAFLLDKMT